MQKLENLANMLDRAECPEEAEFVRDLWQQRAELLEALKGVKKWNDHLGMLSSKLVQSIDEAITKAEAAE